MQVMTVAQVRDGFAEAMRQVTDSGEGVLIEDDGRPLAALVPVEGAMPGGDDAGRRSPDRAAPSNSWTLLAETERLAKLGHWEWDEVTDTCTFCSEGLAELHGVPVDEYMRRTTSSKADLEWVHPDDREDVERKIAEGFVKGIGFEVEYRMLRADGGELEVREVTGPVLDEAGSVVRTVGFIQDITDRKRAEAALKWNESLLRQAAEMARLGYWTWDEIEDRCVYCSQTLAEMCGVTVAEYLERFDDLDALLEEIHPDDRERYARVLADAKRRGTSYDIEFRDRTPGGYRYLRERGEPVFDSHGRIVQTIGIIQDVTEYRRTEEELRRARDELERRVAERTRELQATNADLKREIAEREQAELALRESRDRLRLIADNLPVLIAYLDAGERFRFANRCCAEWYARPVEEILGSSVEEIHGDFYARLRPRNQAALSGKSMTFEETATYPDGVTRQVRMTAVPHLGPRGQVQGFFGLSEDITEIRRAEEMLRQAQKMEAVGQLTGGVAHDFNNLLTVVLGNLELVEERLEEGGELRDHVTRAIRAAERGADLTQHLLAFSRRQVLKPEPLDLNEVVAGMMGLLQRTLGESIEILALQGGDLWLSQADPAQLEAALLNLTINARDAMADGGTLTIETANATLGEDDAEGEIELAPGQYVALTVSDTGVGMSKEVMEHAFEPFYTTKEVGEGSGLGLSMVYGFAKQSGGHVTVGSEKAAGTAITLYLPRAEADPA